MNDRSHSTMGDAGAKALVPLLALTWGLNWIATRLALDDIPLWPLRSVGLGMGALLLFSVAGWRRTKAGDHAATIRACLHRRFL